MSYFDTYEPNPYITDCNPIEDFTDVGDYEIQKSLTGQWAFVPYTGFGDYAGSSVEAANYKVFEEDFRSCADFNGEQHPDIKFFSSMYSYKAVMYRTTTVDKNILSHLKHLEDYPCLSEDLMSEIENEWISEAWQGYGKSDFVAELIKLYPDFEENIYQFNDDKLGDIFYKSCEKSNRYWENEQGNSMYIDIKYVAKHVSFETTL